MEFFGFAGLGVWILELISPYLIVLGEYAPGEVFPYFFTLEMFQRALLASMIVTVVSGFLRSFLLIRNLSLIGDGLAHVSFGGLAVGIVLGATIPLYYALVFSIIASIMIYELQSREILTGDASIAIFLTGMLAFGLVVLRVSGGGITTDIEGYLFGNLLLIDSRDLNFITTVCVISLIALGAISQPLLAISVDPLAALIQGIPVRAIGLLFMAIKGPAEVLLVRFVANLLFPPYLVTLARPAQFRPLIHF